MGSRKTSTREHNENITKTYTYDEAMELTGHGQYNYLLLIGCSIISNSVALDMFGFSIIVAAAKCDLQLNLMQTGLLASAPFTGVFFAYPWGYYADTRGRKRAILWSTIVGFLFAALSSFSPNWQSMLVFKVIACSFSNASFTLTMTILGECTGSKYRSKYLFILISMNLLSECISFGLAYLILPLQYSFILPLLNLNFNSWRLYTLLLALPMGLGGLMLAFLHESPKFIASRGDDKKALDILRSIYYWNGGDIEYPVQHLVTSDDVIVVQKTSFWKSVVQQTVPIFKPPLLWRTLQIFYLMAICSSTNNAFVMWFPTIVNYFFNSFSSGGWDTEYTFCERLFSANNTDVMITTNDSVKVMDDQYICDATISPYTTLSGVIYGIVFCSLTLAVAKVASRKKLVLIVNLIISCVSCMLVNLRNPAASLVFFILLQTTAIGVPGLASYCVDLYPTNYRGLVTSLGMMTARMFSLSGVNLVGAVITNNCSMTFYGFAVFVLSGIIISIFLPSDKKKK